MSSTNDTSEVNIVLKRKLEKVLATDTTNEQFLVALENLGDFYGGNTLGNRLNLRDEMENRCLSVHKQFLTAFGKIQEELLKVESDVLQISSMCESMQLRLETTKAQSGSLINKAEDIFQANARNEACREVITRFLGRFQLTEEEVQALKTVDINHINFFDALKHVRAIHNDCKTLLRTQHQRAGLEIMDNMSEFMEAAYKKLYRWVKNECCSLDRELPDVNALLPEAFAALQERPVLMSYCLQEVGDTRNKAVKRGFLQALTQGGPSGMPRPIELQAHDAPRYIGDMAAWIHQSLASESELITALLRKCTCETEEQKRKYDENKSKILNRCLTDVCVPFRARLVQVLSAKPGLVITYQLANLLDFHRNNFLRLLGPGSTLALCFAECKEDAMKFFFGLAKKLMEKLERAPPIPPIDLSPPHEILEAVQRLSDIITIIESSLVFPDEHSNELDAIVEAVLMPLVDICVQSTPSLSGILRCVYMINCISLMQGAIKDRTFAARQHNLLGAHIEKVMNDMIKLQSATILEDCGLTSKLALLHYSLSQEPSTPLNQVPGLDQQSLTKMLRAFDAKLLDLGTLSMPMIDKLHSQTLRNQARQEVSLVITQAYADLYMTVLVPAHGYTNPESLFRYKPDQVKTMIEP